MSSLPKKNIKIPGSSTFVLCPQQIQAVHSRPCAARPAAGVTPVCCVLHAPRGLCSSPFVGWGDQGAGRSAAPQPSRPAGQSCIVRWLASQHQPGPHPSHRTRVPSRQPQAAASAGHPPTARPQAGMCTARGRWGSTCWAGSLVLSHPWSCGYRRSRGGLPRTETPRSRADSLFPTFGLLPL